MKTTSALALCMLLSGGAAGALAQAPCAGQFRPNVTVNMKPDGTAAPPTACVARKGTVTFCSTKTDDLTADFGKQSPFVSGSTQVRANRTCAPAETVTTCRVAGGCRHSYTVRRAGAAAGDPDIIVEEEP